IGAPAGDLSMDLASTSLDGRESHSASMAGEAAHDAQTARGAAAAQVAHQFRAALSFPVRRVLVAEGEPVLRDAERVLQDLIFTHDPAWFLLRAGELVWQPPRERGSRF